MFGHVICLKFKNKGRMVKTRKVKFKSTENKEIRMTMKMTKTIIANRMLIIMMRMRIKIGNHIKIKRVKTEKCSSKSNSYLLKREKHSKSHSIKKIRTKVVLGASLSRKKEAGYIIPTMNCYLRNG